MNEHLLVGVPKMTANYYVWEKVLLRALLRQCIIWEMFPPAITCQLSEPLPLSTHTHKKNPPHFPALPILRQPSQKQLAWYTNKWPLCHSNYMVYPTVLIGSRCLISAVWSNSKFYLGWLVKIKAMILLISEFWSASLTKPLDGADYPTSWARQIGSIKSLISWISCFK